MNDNDKDDKLLKTAKKIPRRQFLAMSSSTLSLLTLNSSCALVEGAFHPDRRTLDKEVVIVGGGLAGLTAAYHLKQNKIPFRLFEADRVAGGRVLSRELGSTRQIIEMGGEWIAPQHQNISKLAKDLGLRLNEFYFEGKSDQPCFYWQNRIWSFAEVKAQSGNFFPLVEKIRSELLAGLHSTDLIYNPEKIPEMALYYSKLSLRTLGDKYAERMGPVFIAYLQRVVETHFAQSGEEISVLDFMRRYYGWSGQDFWLTKKHRLFRIHGGNQQICKALEERISGVIPNHLVRCGVALTQLSYKEPYFSLKMEDSRNGDVSYFETKNLILALPLSCLQKVMGFSEIPFRSSLRTCLQEVSYSQHSNLFWGLKEKVSKSGNLTRLPLFGSFNNSCLQLVVGSGLEKDLGKDQVVRAFRANLFGVDLSLQDSISELEIVSKGIRSELSAEVDWVNWGQRPWNRGSFARFKIGNFFTANRELNQGDFGGHLAFAGEHTSLNYSGTMEGAVESGRTAAEKMIQQLK